MSQASKQAIAQGIVGGIQGFTQQYLQGRERTQQREHTSRIREALEDESIPDIKKAGLISQLPKEEQAIYLVEAKEKAKYAARRGALQQHRQERPDLYPELATRTTTPTMTDQVERVTPRANVPQVNPDLQRYLRNAELSQEAMGERPEQLQLPQAAPQQVQEALPPVQQQTQQQPLTYQQRRDKINGLVDAGFIPEANAEEKALEFDQRNDIANAQLTLAKQKLVLPIQAKAIEQLHGADESVRALKAQLTAIDEGDVSPFSGANLSKWLDASGWPTLAAMAQTEGGAIFNTAKKQLFTGAKNIFGAKVSDRETQFFDAMQATVGRDPAANRLAVFTLMVPNLLQAEEARYKLNLIEQNPEIDAIKINSLAHKHAEQYKDTLYSQWTDYLNKAVGSRKENKALQAQQKRPTITEIFK